MAHSSRLIQDRAEAHVSLIIATLLLFVLSTAATAQQITRAQTSAAEQQQSGQRLGVRLRSFIPTANASLHFEPTPEGGIVRLVVTSLPPPAEVMATARTFVVWAAASGGRVVRIGELQTDGNGHGGLQFTRPPMLNSYSVLVTAEPIATVEKLTGTVVFASLANEVKAFFAEVDRKVKRAQRAASREHKKRLKLMPTADDFFNEVDRVLRNAPGGGRRIQLFGSQLALGAHGNALVTTHTQKAYVRAHFENLPPPILVSANAYVLWSVVPDGRIIYMGSLPDASHLEETDVYVRVGGFNSEFDLFVTAEQRRPVARPSVHNILTSRPGPLAQ